MADSSDDPYADPVRTGGGVDGRRDGQERCLREHSSRDSFAQVSMAHLSPELALLAGGSSGQ